MNLRQAEITEMLDRWLDRLAPPRHLVEKPQAAQEEVEALLRILTKMAPQSDYQPFIRRVFDQVEYAAKTRTWPTVNELGAACSATRKESPKAADLTGGAEAKTPVQIAAARMARGEPVGDQWLWGSMACELIASREIDEATMKRYRSGAFFAQKATYGEEAALRWEAEMKARHEAAKDVWRDRQAREQRHITIPNKSAKPQWEAAE